MSYELIIPPDTTPPPDRTKITTDKIATDLMAAILANPTLAANYTVSRTGSTLRIVRTTVGTAAITVSDTLLGDGISVITGSTVTGYEDLPSVVPTGTRMRIAENPETDSDDSWAMYDGKKWSECAAPGVQQEVNPYKMPWVLSAIGTPGARSFSFGPVVWDKREAGDDTNNPLPSLAGIDTLFVTEGRLGMTSGADIVLSAVGDPQRIFRRTVLQLLPDDPIAVRSIVGPESSYHTALQWDSGLYLWSDRAQLNLAGEPALTPTTISLSVESRFENTPTVSPLVMGKSIYYLRVVNGAVRVYEYFRPPGYNMPPEVADLTRDVPSYITGTPEAIFGDESLGFIGVRTSAGVFVCHYRRTPQGAIAPRWHQWTFPGAVIHASAMAAGKLYFLLSRSGSVKLEALDVANPADLSTSVPKDASGTVTFPVSWSYDLVGFRDQNGRLMLDGRSTVRNLILHTLHARAGTLGFADESAPRMTVSANVSADLRIPVLRALGPLRLNVSIMGTVTGLDVHGTYTTRNKTL